MQVVTKPYDPQVRERVFDFSRPDGADPKPLFMFLHGGGWISGDPTMYAEEMQWFTARGFACASVGYRLAPLHNFPVPVSDVLAFVAFARENAADLGIDPQRIIAMGNSAGGHLAAMAGLCTSDPASHQTCTPVAGVVAVCPITDIRQPSVSQYPIAMSFLEQFIGCSYEECPDNWASASPVSHVGRSAARFLILHGTQDEIVPNEQSHTLAAALRGHGARPEVIDLEGESHSFTFDAWNTIRDRALTFAQAI